MIQTVIELRYTEKPDGSLVILGDEDRSSYSKVNDYMNAIEHNMDIGPSSSLYTVSQEASESDIQELVDTADNHADHGLVDGAIRGLEIQPGTPNKDKVEEVKTVFNEKLGVDLSNVRPEGVPATHIFFDLEEDHTGNIIPPWAGNRDKPGASPPKGKGQRETPDNARGQKPGKSFEQILKTDMPSVDGGMWKCLHPDHNKVQEFSINEECNLGHSSDYRMNKYVMYHREPFTPPYEI